MNDTPVMAVVTAKPQGVWVLQVYLPLCCAFYGSAVCTETGRVVVRLLNGALMRLRLMSGRVCLGGVHVCGLASLPWSLHLEYSPDKLTHYGIIYSHTVVLVNWYWFRYWPFPGHHNAYLSLDMNLWKC